jgi:hypothetical protein
VGFLILNALSLLLAIGYLIFFLVMEFTNGANTTKKLIREIYRWSKRGIRLFIILLTAYALIFVSKNFSPLSLVLLLLMILGFVLDLLFYFIVKFLSAEADLIIAGVKRDFDELKKPVQTVGNFFKKITGREVEPPPVLSEKEQRLQAILDEQATAVQLQRKEKKQSEKQRKREEKHAKKLAKKQTKKEELQS